MFNEGAEQALIAKLLLAPEHLATVQGLVSPEDFYVTGYREAYRAMLKLVGEGKSPDIIALRSVGVDIDVLSLSAGHKAPPGEYADLIRTAAFRRRYVGDLTALAARAEKEDSPESLVAALQDRAAALAGGVEARDTLGQINLDDFRQAPEDPWLGVVSPQGTTVLYGDGGDGKGWVAAKLAATLKRKVAIIDFEMQPSEWGYRLSRFGATLNDVLYFSPPTTLDRWATEGSARMLKDKGVEFLVIDSAMYASNVDDPYSPNGALAYGRARRRLGNLPALLLAHTTGGADKVFGSVFWRNESRIVWRLNKDFISRSRHLECRKANGYSWLEGRRLNVEFDEEKGILNLHEHGKAWQPAAVAAAPAPAVADPAEELGWG